MRWPRGGGNHVRHRGKDDGPFGQRAPGNDSVYVVCDDPDGLFDRAVAAGAEVVRGLRDEDYGSRGFTVRDPEGNLWSFGTYGEGVMAPTIAHGSLGLVHLAVGDADAPWRSSATCSAAHAKIV